MELEKLHWLGHAAFRFDGSKIIYFDPWKLASHPRPADIIFISHEHFDHFSQDDISLISTKNTDIITAKAVVRKLEGLGINYRELKGLFPGDNLQLEGIKIQAVASYNTNKEFHPKTSKNLGFIITVDNTTIYHAADTDYIPEMTDFRCDIAFLPVSGTYVMNAEEAAKAALAIKPKVAIPMHYADIVGSVRDAQKFENILRGKVEVKILRKET